MNNTSVMPDCQLTLRTYLIQQDRSSHYENFLVFSIVLNSIIAVVASTSNAIVIYTISTNPSLRNPSNILILSLASSDLGVSVLSQSFYCLLLVAELKRNMVLICHASTGNFVTVWAFVFISCLTLVLISADRYLALRLHLRYKELITTRRYIVVLIMIWVSGFGVGALRNYAPSVHGLVNIAFGIFAAGFVFLVMVNAFFIAKIGRLIRRHSKQIRAQKVNMPHGQRLKRSVYTIYYVIGSFVLCYVPYFVLLAISRISELKRSEKVAYYYTMAETIVMLNGVLNPVIYCWRIGELRQAALQTLKKLYSCRNL
ncbi:adenosine receptor A2b-like [Exaiptasia diaphana]|uniref:G-protein coupled receptors family 1 profile domain-containing protein n=1 Tax=Exaiptasia diaphana TaxID=2652724 RepID=A0A913YB57_EXADI|nr:adenosine receptor A2b-like [Exaiptasia diaphana]